MVTSDKSGGHGGGDESLRSMDQKKHAGLCKAVAFRVKICTNYSLAVAKKNSEYCRL